MSELDLRALLSGWCWCDVYPDGCDRLCVFDFETAPPELKTGELVNVTDVKDLSHWPHDLYKVEHWVSDSASGESSNDQRITGDVAEADIISSKIASSPKHTIMLDLDITAKLVPSSTPGHTHLYIDAPVSWDAYCRLLDSLEECGVLEPGYVGASKARGYTALRLPWVKKDASQAERCRVECVNVSDLMQPTAGTAMSDHEYEVDSGDMA